jgi:cytochrome P450
VADTLPGPLADTIAGPLADTLPGPLAFPVRRTCPFDPPEEYRRLRAEHPISRLRLPGGRVGWLVTRYDDVRAVIADPRLTPPVAQVTPVEDLPLPPEELQIPPGTFSALDAPEHGRYRKLVSPAFTMRRVRDIAPAIARLVDDQLTVMMRGGPPADLVDGFAIPVSLAMMAMLLGVPPDGQERFKRASLTMFSLTSTADQLRVATEQLYGGMQDLVAAKRGRPGGTDLLSRLVTDDNGLTDTEAANMGALLMLAGLAMTAHMLALGTFALLEHPDQLAALRADQSLMDGAIEELLRYLSIVQWGLTRTAREDLVIGGLRVRAGETVVASLASANRDPRAFPEPDRFLLGRAQNPHLAFGHGMHHCLGAPLGREIMRAGLGALLSRLPGLRLAVPAAEIARGEDMVFYGVHALPVAWDRQP